MTYERSMLPVDAVKLRERAGRLLERLRPRGRR